MQKVYSYPVKYIDVKGNVCDITNEIAATKDETYVTVANAVQTTFPQTLSNGIALAYKDIAIKLCPEGDTRKGYALTYIGFKENIIVKEYTGEQEYSFRLYTGGLTLKEEQGNFVLVDEKGTITATLSLDTNMSSYTIVWSSSDTSIATVNSSGLVTGVRAGIATITATGTASDGISARSLFGVWNADVASWSFL